MYDYSTTGVNEIGQEIIDSTGTVTWQNFSRMTITEIFLENCLSLLKIKYLLAFDLCLPPPVALDARLSE